MRAWRERNRDHVRAQKAAWLEANRDHARAYNRLQMRRYSQKKKREAEKRERRREYAREWYARNRERYAQQQKESRARRKAEDPERFRAMANARMKRWRDKNRDAYNKGVRDRRRAEPGSRAESSRRYYEKNREQILERARQRYAANHETARAKANAYQARERRRRDAGLPPRRLHSIRPAERDMNQRDADDFFARAYTGEELKVMRTALATPPELYAAWQRECSRARAAHRRATDPDVIVHRSEARQRAEAARELVRQNRSAEDARLDAIAHDINDRLRLSPRRRSAVDSAPHQSPAGPAGPQHRI